MNNLPNRIEEKTLPPTMTTGFTLVEILVTLVLIAVGCLAAVHLQAKAMQGGTRAELLTVATFLAESEYERLRNLDTAGIQLELYGDDNAYNTSGVGKSKTEFLNKAGDTCKSKDEDGKTVETTCSERRSIGFPFERRTTITPGIPMKSNSHLLNIAIIWDGTGSRASRVEFEAALTDITF